MSDVGLSFAQRLRLSTCANVRHSSPGRHPLPACNVGVSCVQQLPFALKALTLSGVGRRPLHVGRNLGRLLVAGDPAVGQALVGRTRQHRAHGHGQTVPTLGRLGGQRGRVRLVAGVGALPHVVPTLVRRVAHVAVGVGGDHDLQLLGLGLRLRLGLGLTLPTGPPPPAGPVQPAHDVPVHAASEVLEAVRVVDGGPGGHDRELRGPRLPAPRPLAGREGGEGGEGRGQRRASLYLALGRGHGVGGGGALSTRRVRARVGLRGQRGARRRLRGGQAETLKDVLKLLAVHAVGVEGGGGLGGTRAVVGRGARGHAHRGQHLERCVAGIRAAPAVLPAGRGTAAAVEAVVPDGGGAPADGVRREEDVTQRAACVTQSHEVLGAGGVALGVELQEGQRHDALAAAPHGGGGGGGGGAVRQAACSHQSQHALHRLQPPLPVLPSVVLNTGNRQSEHRQQAE